MATRAMDWLVGMGTVMALAAFAGRADAGIQMDVSVQRSTYVVSASDTAASLMAAFNATPGLAGSCTASVTGFTGVGPGTCHSSSSDQATLMTLNFDLASAGAWDFRVGPDWGRGGAVLLDGTVKKLVTGDWWWGGNWSRQTIETLMDLSAGHHTLQWLGFEGCCSGNMAVQFKGGDTATWTDLTVARLADALPTSPVPEPATGALVALGLGSLLLRRRPNARLLPA